MSYKDLLEKLRFKIRKLMYYLKVRNFLKEDLKNPLNQEYIPYPVIILNANFYKKYIRELSFFLKNKAVGIGDFSSLKIFNNCIENEPYLFIFTNKKDLSNCITNFYIKSLQKKSISELI